MNTISQNIEIINKLGLHARAAAKLVRVTSQFKCRITIGKDGLETDAKSILGMMSLAAGKGTQLTVSVMERTLKPPCHRTECIADRFGEAE